MPRWAEVLLTLVLFAVASPAAAQDITIPGLARSASAMSAVVRFCGPFFVIDGPKATTISSAARKVILETEPVAKNRALLTTEFKRRFREVEITGAPFWCQKERDVQRNLGTGIFLN